MKFKSVTKTQGWLLKPHRWLPKEECLHQVQWHNGHQFNNNSHFKNRQVGQELSSVHLTKAQASLLAHGPNFTIDPRHPPYGEYITAMEQACHNLEPYEGKELRAELREVHEHSYTARSNVTTEEMKALKELRLDKTWLILTADRGVALVLDKTDYNKAEKMLEDE